MISRSPFQKHNLSAGELYLAPNPEDTLSHAELLYYPNTNSFLISQLRDCALPFKRYLQDVRRISRALWILYHDWSLPCVVYSEH